MFRQSFDTPSDNFEADTQFTCKNDAWLCQFNAAPTSGNESYTQMPFQRFHLLADSRLGYVQAFSRDGVTPCFRNR